MILIVGLGNPNKEYEHTRHNAGFLALDTFAKEHEFPAFKLSKKHAALVSEGILGSTKVVLAKPQTFMNNSGKAVTSLVRSSWGKLDRTKELPTFIVVHDDIDIPIGTARVSRGRGSAGHKGVESVIEALGFKDFTRMRIGIRPIAGKPEDVENFVLQKFSPTELPVLQSSIQEAVNAITGIIKGG
ncbi:MAG: aminoacyl-tRNA hydrolase [Parcubacteria group bacterium]|nr:aminoacyl-tRNA hydrolase [Parcubacteria group bacterium]